jgi:hypothetical protein
MDDAPASGHPLNIAGGDCAVVPHAVAVFDGSSEDVSDGFDTAMRVPRKTGEVILGHIIPEIIEEEERVKVRSIAEAEGPAQMHTSAFESRFRFNQPFNRSQ